MAITFAIKKCDLFVRGTEFQVHTDHKPLVNIWQKPLAEIDNDRILRMRMKTLAYQYELRWIEGKNNILADTFSRSPSKRARVIAAIKPMQFQIADNPASQALKQAAKECPKYQAILDALRNSKRTKDLPPDHPARHLAQVWDNLSVTTDGLLLKNARQIFTPIAYRANVIDKLHIPHCGTSKTMATARKLSTGLVWRRTLEE